MNKKEKELFKQLCSFKSEKFNDELLKFTTPVVLGQLFFNRMQGVAYGRLKNQKALSKVNREFRNSLKGAYEQNTDKNKSLFVCIEHLNKVFYNCDFRYAMLKGALLCKSYPEGYRTSNDIDLLVMPKDVTKVGCLLQEDGFKQGNIRNGEFQPATRKEIIESKMMRGETVPYIKKVNLPGMRYLEVDINFSLDYKSGDSALLKEMLNHTYTRNIDGLEITTLNDEDFFIHLCSHLYKEATTMAWIEMKRDMTLYKYMDIYMILSEASKELIDKIFIRAMCLGVEKICAFTIIQTACLLQLDNKYAVTFAENILKRDPEFINRVDSPQDKKIYIYSEKDILKRFFADDRTKFLKEVETVAKT